jgi:hypothetical protein
MVFFLGGRGHANYVTVTNWSVALRGQAAAHREEVSRRLVSSTLCE